MRIERHFSKRLGEMTARTVTIERSSSVIETLAPAGWTSARVETWLDWAAALPNDLPPSSGEISLDDTLLGGGPARYTKRQACWGEALGLFDGSGAQLFAEELLAILALGLFAPGQARASGARLHPLAPDTSTAPPEREIAGRLTEFQIERLRAVSDAVIRCDGDPAECADPTVNQALARAALGARNAGVADPDIADAIALGREGRRFELAAGFVARASREAVEAGDAEVAARRG